MTSQTHPPLLSDKDGYLGLLNDPSQMTFLLQAWALARRILLIERSVEALVVMLSTKWDDTDAGELPGDVTLLRGAIRGFLSHNQPQFISSMSLDDWGSTRAIWPHHIHLKHSMIEAGGRTLDLHRRSTSYYRSQLFFLAVVVTHACVHWLRMRMHVVSGGTIEFATPPRLAVPGGGCGRPVKRLGQEVVPGEGGWCYEDMVYGGKVLARGLDTGAGDLVHEQNVALWMMRLSVPVGVRFRLDLRSIDKIVLGQPGWHLLLPLQGTYEPVIFPPPDRVRAGGDTLAKRKDPVLDSSTSSVGQAYGTRLGRVSRSEAAESPIRC